MITRMAGARELGGGGQEEQSPPQPFISIGWMPPLNFLALNRDIRIKKFGLVWFGLLGIKKYK